MANLKFINNGIKEACRKYGLKYEIESRGNPNGDIVVIVDCPTLIDIKNNSLMSGMSSKLLFKLLFENKISFDRLYITSASKRYEILDEKSHSKLVKGDIYEYYKNIFNWELSQLPNVKYVFCLGSLASSLYNKESSISQLRGTLFTQDNKKICYSINPALLGRDSRLSFLINSDIRKFATNISERSVRVDRKLQCNYGRNGQDIRTFFEAEPNGEYSFDIETCGDDVSCISFAARRDRHLTIRFVDKELQRVFGEDEQNIINVLLECMQKARLITQNGEFDMCYLSKKWKFKPFPIYKDTMILHNEKFPGYPHSLQFLNSIYSDFEFYKFELKEWKKDIDIDMLALYNLKDALVTLDAANQMERNEKIMNEYNILISCASKGIEINHGEIGKTKAKVDLDYARALNVWSEDANRREIEVPKPNMKTIKEYVEKNMKLKLQKGKASIDEKIYSLIDWKYISHNDKETLKALVYILRNKNDMKKTKEFVGNVRKTWYPYFNVTKLGQTPGRIYVEDDFSRIRGGHNMFRTYPKSFCAREGMSFVKIKPNFLTIRTIAREYQMKSFESVISSPDPIESNLRLMFPQIKEIVKDEFYPNGNKTHYWISSKMLEHGNYPIDIAETSRRWKIGAVELESVLRLYKKVHPEIDELNKSIVELLNNQDFIEAKNGRRFYKIPDFDENDIPIYLQFMWESLAHDKIIEIASDEHTVYVDEDVIIYEVPQEEQNLIAGNLVSKYDNLIKVDMSSEHHNVYTTYTKSKPVHFLEDL